MGASVVTFIIYLVSSVVCLGFWGYYTVHWWDSLTKGLRGLSVFLCCLYFAMATLSVIGLVAV